MALSNYNVQLTSKGFKIVANSFFYDVINVILVSLPIVFNLTNLNLLLSIGLIYALSSGIYYYYKKTIGYLYPLSFFYHISLIIIFCPIVYLHPFSIILGYTIFLGLLFWRKQDIVQFNFPISLLILLFIILSGSGLLYFSIINPNYSNVQFDKISESLFLRIPGLHFVSLPVTQNPEIFKYTLAEKMGMFLILYYAILVLKEIRAFKDLLLILIVFFTILPIYGVDFLLYYQGGLIYTVIWYMIYNSPGRNYQAMFKISLISSGINLVLSIILSYLFYGKINPFYLILMFYIFNSIFFYLFIIKSYDKQLFHKGLVTK